MNDDGPKGLVMIGLHRLVAGEGNAMVPELYTLIANRDETSVFGDNVILFPLWAARPPGEAPTEPLGADARNGRNLVAFALRPAKTAARRKSR